MCKRLIYRKIKLVHKDPSIQNELNEMSDYLNSHPQYFPKFLKEVFKMTDDEIEKKFAVNTCDGDKIPLYRKQSTLRKNPFYGTKSTDPAINTTDEFIRESSWLETDWVCMDCKQKDCSDGQKERDIYRKTQEPCD
jgi:hypothetical protein